MAHLFQKGHSNIDRWRKVKERKTVAKAASDAFVKNRQNATTPSRSPSIVYLNDKELRNREICAGVPIAKEDTKISDFGLWDILMDKILHLVKEGWRCSHCNHDIMKPMDVSYYGGTPVVKVACSSCKTFIFKHKLGKTLQNEQGKKYEDIAMKMTVKANETGHSHSLIEQDVLTANLNPLSKGTFYRCQSISDDLDIAYADQSCLDAMQKARQERGLGPDEEMEVDAMEDGSFDKRRNANNGNVVTMIESSDPNTNNLIIAQSNLTKKDALNRRNGNYVGTSNGMEDEGGRRNADFLAQNNVFYRSKTKDNDTNGDKQMNEYNEKYERDAELLKEGNHTIKNFIQKIAYGKTAGNAIYKAMKKDDPKNTTVKKYSRWTVAVSLSLSGRLKSWKQRQLRAKAKLSDWKIVEQELQNVKKHIVTTKKNKNHKYCNFDCHSKKDPNRKLEKFVVDGVKQTSYPVSYSAQIIFGIHLNKFFTRKVCDQLIRGKETNPVEGYNSLKRKYIKRNSCKTAKHFQGQSSKALAQNNKPYVQYLDRQKKRGVSASARQIKLVTIRKQQKLKLKIKSSSKSAKILRRQRKVRVIDDNK